MNPNSSFSIESKAMCLITLLTDFGLRDGFIGVMKGVISQIDPNARLVDISHDLPAFSISAASFLIEWAYRYFPEGSVHLCVVDPGVGSSRRALVVESRGHIFVAPDNGLLTPFFDSTAAVRVIAATKPEFWLPTVSHTFHGRDVFAPLAAHAARGIPPSQMGGEIHDPVRLPFPPLNIQPNSIECQIRYIDHFGNCITNLDQSAFSAWLQQNAGQMDRVRVTCQQVQITGIANAYAATQAGEFLAVFNGYNRLEIAVRNGSAEEKGALQVADPVVLILT
ncbi:MAG: SAM-dependent chlorinase/fluorinase [bacterium]|jgi:S-adenosylmethionine hydrolase|nr:SAM-dependent chlorinase/fluorinase [bacterium]